MAVAWHVHVCSKFDCPMTHQDNAQTPTWENIKACFGELVRLRQAGTSVEIRSAWETFADTVVASRDHPPYHLVSILDHLQATEAAFPDTPRSAISILDHGCGSGLTVLYLIAIGYHGARGVDVGGKCDTWNVLLTDIIGGIDPHFTIYDGRWLPFENDTLHYIFSQQVLEHVSPENINAYYDEEARVAVKGGMVHHQVPHRLVPYESHSKTWFVHYLPRGLAQFLYKRLGRNSKTITHHLFLRTPRYHRHQMHKRFGNCVDVTNLRLMRPISFDYYDGPVRLRRALASMLNIPLIGKIMCLVIRDFVMIDTCSFKQESPRN